MNSSPVSERRVRVQRAPGKRVLDSAFAPVKLAEPVAPSRGSAVRLQARLPNGVVVTKSNE